MSCPRGQSNEDSMCLLKQLHQFSRKSLISGIHTGLANLGLKVAIHSSLTATDTNMFISGDPLRKSNSTEAIVDRKTDRSKFFDFSCRTYLILKFCSIHVCFNRISGILYKKFWCEWMFRWNTIKAWLLPSYGIY